MDNVESRVKRIITEAFGAKANNMTLETQLVNDLAADSLDTVELIISIENEFNIKISEADANEIFDKPNCCVGDIVKYLETTKF